MLKLLFLHNFSKRQVTIACLFWFLFIAFLCGIPGKDLPHASWFELVSLDKWVHACLFFVLCLWWLILGTFNSWPKVWIILLCLLYGGVLEILQDIIFVERSADWMDFVANSFGTLTGWLASEKWKVNSLKQE